MSFIIATLFISALITFPGPSDVLAATEYDIYAKAEYFEWKEFDGGSKLLEESGPIFGIGVSAKGTIYKSITLKGRGELFWGSVDYDGQTQVGTPVDTDTDYAGFKIEVDGGWKFLVKGESSLEPFAGLGMRQWNRDIKGTNFASGVEEDWTTIYARLGIRGDHVYPNTLKVFAEAALKLPFDNENEADLNQFDVTLEPGNKASFFAELGLKWKKFKSSIYYEGMRFSKSDTEFAGGFRVFQPKSEADIFGINAGISF
jgi:hypothetical protein